MSDGVDSLLSLYRGEAGGRRYDEYVTEAEHTLQCAHLAVLEGADDALVAAALLHDVGHLLGGGAAHGQAAEGDGISLPEADDEHERVGARRLRALFGPTVSAPVALHVEAKRYLCAVDASYAASLSPSSTHSLALQDGAMDADAATAFRGRRGWESAVALRRWDDRAKVVGSSPPAFEVYEPLLRRLVAGGGA